MRQANKRQMEALYDGEELQPEPETKEAFISSPESEIPPQEIHTASMMSALAAAQTRYLSDTF